MSQAERIRKLSVQLCICKPIVCPEHQRYTDDAAESDTKESRTVMIRDFEKSLESGSERTARQTVYGMSASQLKKYDKGGAVPCMRYLKNTKQP